MDRHYELSGEGVEEESRVRKEEEGEVHGQKERREREEGLASCVDHPTCTSGGTGLDKTKPTRFGLELELPHY